MQSTGTKSSNRGKWNSKLGFILAAAGSAVGLGNIWRFPTVMADNGGAIFLLIYALLVFIIGYPVMVAEMTLGRHTQRNPVGAIRSLTNNRFLPLIGFLGVVCGVGILSYYVVIAGWTVSYFLEQIFFHTGLQNAAIWISDLGNSWITAFFTVLFMGFTVTIIHAGVSQGIERAVRFLMPMLVIIMIILIGYVLFQPGAGTGLREYLMPDFSRITAPLILAALGQAFFSLSLGMGALITYGSYLSKRENIPEAAAYVTGFDIGIAFLAGLLIMPTMYMAQAQGVAIFDEAGNLIAGFALIFQILPELFHSIGGLLGLIFGASFFFLLSIAALTSAISLLEVPVSYTIDEHGLSRKKATYLIAVLITLVSLIIAFNTSFIDGFDYLFSTLGLPLGGLLICLFLAWVWRTANALDEMKQGYEQVDMSMFGKVWPLFIKYICPVLIALVLGFTIYNAIAG